MWPLKQPEGVRQPRPAPQQRHAAAQQAADARFAEGGGAAGWGAAQHAQQAPQPAPAFAEDSDDEPLRGDSEDEEPPAKHMRA